MPPGGQGVGVGTHMHNELLCLARAHMPWSLSHPGVVGGWGLRKNNRVFKKKNKKKRKEKKNRPLFRLQGRKDRQLLGQPLVRGAREQTTRASGS